MRQRNSNRTIIPLVFANGATSITQRERRIGTPPYIFTARIHQHTTTRPEQPTEFSAYATHPLARHHCPFVYAGTTYYFERRLSRGSYGEALLYAPLDNSFHKLVVKWEMPTRGCYEEGE